MLHRILALIIKEFLAILRDAKSRMVLIGPPLIQLVVFGYAASFDLNHVPFAVYDQDRSVAAQDLVAHFTGSPAFTEVASLKSDHEIKSLINSRQVEMVLVIDPRFSRDLLTGKAAPVQVIVDGRNSNTALLILGYANAVITAYSQSWAATHGLPSPPAQLDPRALFNPNLDSHWFIIPGIVALLTQVVTLLVVGLSVAREREAGTFDQILVTPMRPLDILLGKSIPGLIIGVVEGSVIILATVFWFKVPLYGGLLQLYLGLLLFVFSVTGIGLMISSLAATQQQALLGAFLFMVPSIILSGFATPISNMPVIVQDLTWINPMRYALVIIRRSFLEHPSFTSLLPQYLPMAALALVSLAAAGWLFRKRAV
ncbi:antibiotic ABC transporter permease [Acidocella aquatica]|uniref:Antibiotic ABC transporter permease n=1 Tax=Acidocella aquatica TaxID=1922313 RepID=A0ABQ6A840_9PROT|nr:ABC transporter permease [Acidocella aquatica]GLR68635.1 antibiotic ABC transporter permease [Acidocella aquatica]